MASAEFGPDRRTIATRIRAAGVLPGPDGKFSTADVSGAIYGDYEIQRARKMAEDADAQALANARTRHELIDKADFMHRWETIYAAMRQKILTFPAPDAEKDALLADLEQLHHS